MERTSHAGDAGVAVPDVFHEGVILADFEEFVGVEDGGCDAFDRVGGGISQGRSGIRPYQLGER